MFGGRFVAILRALMPAAAGAASVRYRVFFLNNLVSGIVWGVGYSLLGYLAGSAYATVERTVGVGFAVAAVVAVLALVVAFAWRRHRDLLQRVPERTDESI